MNMYSILDQLLFNNNYIIDLQSAHSLNVYRLVLFYYF